MVISISLMGPPELRGPGGTMRTGCAQSLNLLAFLCTRPGRAAARGALSLSLWANADQERARTRLNTALWRLRKAIDAAGLPPDSVLASTGETVALRPDAPLWLDVEQLRHCWRVARDTRSAPLSDDAADELGAGARLYRGAFLPGHDDDWCLMERETLTAAYQAILERLLQHHTAERAWRAVLDTAGRLLALDPLIEHAHRAAIRAHGALGDRAQAARQFRRCRALLMEELAVPPLPETVSALREAMALDDGRCAVDGRTGSGRSPSLGNIIGDLKSAVRELERLHLRTD